MTALDGSKISLRQKYGNIVLTYSSTDKGTSLIPTPISVQCIIVTKDRQIVLMQRPLSVAFYFHTYGVDEVAAAIKAKKDALQISITAVV